MSNGKKSHVTVQENARYSSLLYNYSFQSGISMMRHRNYHFNSAVEKSETRCLIHAADTVGSPAITRNFFLLKRKFVVIGDLLPCFDVAGGKHHDFLLVVLHRDYSGIRTRITAVVHKTCHTSLLSSIHDVVSIQTE